MVTSAVVAMIMRQNFTTRLFHFLFSSKLLSFRCRRHLRLVSFYITYRSRDINFSPRLAKQTSEVWQEQKKKFTVKFLLCFPFCSIKQRNLRRFWYFSCFCSPPLIPTYLKLLKHFRIQPETLSKYSPIGFFVRGTGTSFHQHQELKLLWASENWRC